MNLLPLEVLPGWPQPEPVSDTFLMFLMVIGPLAFGVLVTLLYFGPKLARERRERELEGDAVVARRQLDTTRPDQSL